MGSGDGDGSGAVWDELWSSIGVTTVAQVADFKGRERVEYQKCGEIH